MTVACATGGSRSTRAWRAPSNPGADVPLRVWQEQWPPGRSASVDAFARVLGLDLSGFRT